MVVKLLKPVPMVNKVLETGSYVDSEKLFVELIHSGRAELVDAGVPAKNEATNHPAEEKPVEKEVPAVKEVVKEAEEVKTTKRGRKAKE